MRNSVMDAAKNDFALLEEYAASQGFQGELQPWDYDYVRHVRKRDLLGYIFITYHPFMPYIAYVKHCVVLVKCCCFY